MFAHRFKTKKQQLKKNNTQQKQQQKKRANQEKTLYMTWLTISALYVGATMTFLPSKQTNTQNSITIILAPHLFQFCVFKV